MAHPIRVIEVDAELPAPSLRRAQASWERREEPEEQLLSLAEAARRLGLEPGELRRRLTVEERVIVRGQALELRMSSLVAMRRA